MESQPKKVVIVGVVVVIVSHKNLTLKFGQHWGSTAEIFLIWKNVPRTNFPWTNVNLIVGIFSRCSQEPTFKVYQNRASNS